MSMDKGLLSIIDANFNRCKEGMRVVEDLFRFLYRDDLVRRDIRKLRHALDDISKSKIIKNAIMTRNSRYDLGRATDNLEMSRANVADIFFSNLQRAKESLRVLEECFKIVDVTKVDLLKKARYDTYTFEKKVLSRWAAVFNPRQRSAVKKRKRPGQNG
ncbi:MAG: thiamine-phosphate pyrophosphorylase [Candidatus Omnitrophica bacterium]|nr:thiamine-phosphate pyrophosphorylase [Candidatus Omnitrophota bacterium]